LVDMGFILVISH